MITGLAFAVGAAHTPVRSAGWALALATLIVTLVATSARRPASVALGLGAAAFTPWLSLRFSPWLITVNLLVMVVLLLAALGLPAAAGLQVSVAHHGLRILRACAGLPFGPGHVLHAAKRGPGSVRAATVQRWGPSALAGGGALLVGLLILASGDALLASFFDVDDAVEVIDGRVAAGIGGLVVFGIFAGAVHVPGSPDNKPVRVSLPAMPMLFAIAGLSIAIGIYAATQVSAALLGAGFVASRTGLTYAEYARAGFFQMAIIAGVSTCAVSAARAVVREHPIMTRRIRVAAAALTVGVMVTVASAVIKLTIYLDTFGLTMLRVYTVTFACWLGIVAVLALIALLRRSAAWFAPTLLASMAIGAFAMNVVNPEHIVAQHNLNRADSTGQLDVAYLSLLSLDAAPVILAGLDDIDAEFEDPTRSQAMPLDAATELREVWCARVAGHDDHQGANAGAMAFNLARSEAIEAGLTACS